MARGKHSPTDHQKELITQLLPEDEVGSVYSEVHMILKKWVGGIEGQEEMDVLAPNAAQASMMDTLLKDALVNLSKDGIRGSLKKLSWTLHVLFDPDYTKDWTEEENRPYAAISHRAAESDAFLTEHRDIHAHRADDVWLIQFQNEHGDIVRKERTFPFWGREFKLGLASKKEAADYYRGQLIKRKILKPKART